MNSKLIVFVVLILFGQFSGNNCMSLGEANTDNSGRISKRAQAQVSVDVSVKVPPKFLQSKEFSWKSESIEPAAVTTGTVLPNSGRTNPEFRGGHTGWEPPTHRIPNSEEIIEDSVSEDEENTYENRTASQGSNETASEENEDNKGLGMFKELMRSTNVSSDEETEEEPDVVESIELNDIRSDEELPDESEYGEEASSENDLIPEALNDVLPDFESENESGLSGPDVSSPRPEIANSEQVDDYSLNDLYDEPGPGSPEKRRKRSTASDLREFREEALNLFNSYRNRVGLSRVSLDNNLNNGAQRWAAQSIRTDSPEISCESCTEYTEAFAQKKLMSATRELPTGAQAADWAVKQWFEKAVADSTDGYSFVLRRRDLSKMGVGAVYTRDGNKKKMIVVGRFA